MKNVFLKCICLFTILLIYTPALDSQCGIEGSTSFPVSTDCYPNTTNSYRIPVYFHVIEDINSPTINMNQINTIIQELNIAYKSYNSVDFTQSFSFELAQYDENFQCFNGVKYYSINESKVINTRPNELNNSLYSELSLNMGTLKNRYLNIFMWDEVCVPSNCSISGIAWPAQAIHVRKNFSHLTGLVVHESGHYFSLRHAFDYGCSQTVSNCILGDEITSTPVVAKISISNPNNCNNFKACDDTTPYPVENYMTYAFACYESFVPEQIDRMGYHIDGWQGADSPFKTNIVTASNLGLTVDGPNTEFLVHSNVTTSINEDISVVDNVVLRIIGNVTLSNANIHMGVGSKIRVLDGSTLTIDNCNMFSACNTALWEGVIVEEGGSLVLENKTLIQDAQYGAYCFKGSKLEIDDADFLNCAIAIQLGEGQSIFGNSSALSVEIIAINDLTIEITEPILPLSNGGPPTTESIGIYLHSSPNSLSGLDNEIINCTYGILSNKMSSVVSEYTLKNCGKGISTEHTIKSYPYFYIKDCTFDECTTGIDLRYARCLIEINNFYSNGTDIRLNRVIYSKIKSNNTAWDVAPFSNQPFDISNVYKLDIVNNSYIGYTATNTSFINNSWQVTMENNGFNGDLEITNVYGSKFRENDFNQRVELFGGGNNQINCNVFFYAVNDTDPNLISNASTGNTFAHNITGGFVFNGHNGNSLLIDNEFDGNIDYGLLLGELGQIGPQSDNENEWTGSYSVKDAQHLSLDDQFVIRSLFTSNVNFTPDFAPSAFFDESQNPESIIENCDQGPGNNITPWEDEKDGFVCVDSILFGQSFDYLNAKERYALLMSIYFRYQYLDDQGITFSSDCNSTLDSLLVNCLTQSVEYFLEVNKLQSNYDSTNILTELVNYSNGTPNHTQWEGITSSIDSVLLVDSITSYMLFDQLDTIDFDLSFCTEDTLPSTDLSNSISISNSSFINDSISNAEENQLLAIATSCYSEAGLAKYHAKATLNEYGITVPEPTCVSIRDRKVINKTNKLYITPNPADNILHIDINDAGNFIIIDIKGKVIRSEFLNEGRSSFDISNLEKGTYVIYCKETNAHAKFIKI